MKKIFYTLALGASLLFASQVNAQTFTIPKDTVKVVPYGYVELKNDVTNTTGSDISVEWKVIYNNLTQSWKDHSLFGICDNQLCYDKSILGGSTQTTLPISGNSTGTFKLQVDGSDSKLSAAPAGSELYVTVELKHSTTIDTVTFVINKWTTSVNNVAAKALDVTLYPNPAKSELNVKFDKNSGVKSVAVYNLIGKKVKSANTSNGTDAKLNIADTPSGIYFVRLMNESGQVLATRRFTHQ